MFIIFQAFIFFKMRFYSYDKPTFVAGLKNAFRILTAFSSYKYLRSNYLKFSPFLQQVWAIISLQLRRFFYRMNFVRKTNQPQFLKSFRKNQKQFQNNYQQYGNHCVIDEAIKFGEVFDQPCGLERELCVNNANANLIHKVGEKVHSVLEETAVEDDESYKEAVQTGQQNEPTGQRGKQDAVSEALEQLHCQQDRTLKAVGTHGVVLRENEHARCFAAVGLVEESVSDGAVEKKHQKGSDCGHEVDFVFEAEAEGERDLAQTVQAQNHEVRLNDSHQQHPPASPLSQRAVEDSGEAVALAEALREKCAHQPQQCEDDKTQSDADGAELFGGLAEVERRVRGVVTGVDGAVVRRRADRELEGDELHVNGLQLEEVDDLDLLHEESHALGVGGIRVVLVQPELLHEERKRDVRLHGEAQGQHSQGVPQHLRNHSNPPPPIPGSSN